MFTAYNSNALLAYFQNYPGLEMIYLLIDLF